MRFTNVTTITTKPGQMRDFLQNAEEKLLPLYRELPGFVAYTVAQTGDATAICFGIWDERAHAEEAVKTSNQWMKQSTGVLIDSLHTSIGKLPFIALKGELVAYTSDAPVAGSRI